MFSVGLKLRVLHNSDITNILSELEADFPLYKCEVKENCVFYRIDALLPYTDDNDNEKEYTEVRVGNEYFITPYTVEELEEIINAHLKSFIFFNRS